MDGDSSCWISTAGGGVIYFNEYSGKVKQYTNRDGLSNNTVCGLLRDDKNDLWIVPMRDSVILTGKQTSSLISIQRMD
jgi:ligand-binding sensor domain-containing protein